MPEWEAPAKVNLDLRVAAADASGLHPLRSIVQTIELCDRLRIEEGDEDVLRIGDAGVPDDEDNLIWKAVKALGWEGRPPLDITLEKRVPVAAGLGGGSADAAATLLAVGGEMGRLPPRSLQTAAAAVGADVPFLLVGGTARIEGYGERITALDPLGGLGVAVVVPPFELATAAVYRQWDEMGGPTGPEFGGRLLPPPLRRLGELRNDLTPAAIALRPDLGDWMRDLGGRWSTPVMMSGSGPACFAFFVDPDEAGEAAEGAGESRAAAAAGLRARGAAPAEA